MRGLVFLLLAAQAQAAPLGYDDARHLLVRTGFGPTDAEVRAYAPLTREQAVDELLDGTRTQASTPPPEWVTGPFERAAGGLKDAPPAVRQAFRGEMRDRAIALRAWWYREMLVTPSPLTERMTLFWHDHFATSQQKVRSNVMMYRQNAIFRRNAVGSFRALLHEVAKDPAMLVYLDGAASRKEHPNENFAREVMELFTLGEGHYTEDDIKQAARAFTGWSVDRRTGEFLYRPRLHDVGEKHVLGVSANLDGDAMLDVLLAQPACAPFIVRALWKELVSPTPDEREVMRIATVLRDGDWELKPVLHALLLTRAFWDARNRGTLVRSPVELVVGTLRQLDASPTDLTSTVLAAAALGQNVFLPPNVKGWPDGDGWIDASTLLARKTLLSRLVSQQPSLPVDVSSFLATLPSDPAQRDAHLRKLLLPTTSHRPPSPDALVALRDVVLDPVYQLK